MAEVKDFHRANNITTIYLKEDVSKQVFLAKVNQLVVIEKYEVSKPSSVPVYGIKLKMRISKEARSENIISRCYKKPIQLFPTRAAKTDPPIQHPSCTVFDYRHISITIISKKACSKI